MSARRTALVTGAARGIGAAIAARLAKEGHHVVFADILDEVEARRDEILQAGGSATAVRVDLSDLASIDGFMAGLIERHGSVDIVVNNAGISPKHDGKRAPVQDTGLDEWQSVLDVNLTAPYLICKAAVPGMRSRRWGRIVNMSSQAARTKSMVAGSHYAASKAGLIGFSRTLAGEVGADGVTVNCIAPGRIDTPMAASAGADVNTAYVSTIPVGRIGTTEDVAEAVAFLASDRAGFITGVVLDVNGGHFMG